MKLWMNYAATFAVGASMLLASCGADDTDDDPIVDINEAPTLTVQNPDMSAPMTSVRVAMAAPNELREFLLVADDGNDNLQTVTFLQNGTVVDVSTAPSDAIRFEIDGNVSALDENPKVLFDDDTDGFSKTIRLRAPADFNDSVTYTITVQDTGEDDLTNPEEASVEITLVTGTAPVLLVEKRDVEFFNMAGTQPGALDLDQGIAVPSANNTTSELQDQGLSPQGAWRQTVSPENGASLRRVLNAGADFYDNVRTVDELRNAWDNATTTIGTSDRLMDGDVYVVMNPNPPGGGGDKFYLIEFAEVIDVPNTNAGDKYVVNIKQAP